MAITLDELLGRNLNTTSESTERFPSYDEFNSARRNADAAASTATENRGYDYFAPRGYVSPRSTESAREYEAARIYERPRDVEYQPSARDFDFAKAEKFEKAPAYNAAKEEFAAPTNGAEEYRPLSLFEFAKHDNDRLSDKELFGKLDYAPSQVARPVFDRDESAYVMREDVTTARPARKSIASVFSRNTAYKSQSETKKHGKISLKGKVLIGIYAALILTVTILIAVNAKDINTGKAAVPSAAVAPMQIERNIEG